MKTLAAVGVGVLVAGLSGRGCGTGGQPGRRSRPPMPAMISSPARSPHRPTPSVSRPRRHRLELAGARSVRTAAACTATNGWKTFGLDIHNSNQIRQDWQHLARGD